MDTNTNMLDGGVNEAADRATASALETLAAERTLPGLPVDGAAHWKRSAIPMARRRAGRWAAVGMAAAAGLTLAGVMLFPSWRSSQVHASTILGSLRDASIRGVNVRLTGIQEEGASVQGSVHLRFAQPLLIDALVGEGENVPEPQIAEGFASLDVRLGDGTPVPGLDLHVELAGSDRGSWAFVIPNAGNQPRPQEQGVGIALGFLRQGILLDLGANNIFAEGGWTPPEGAHDAASSGESGVKVHVVARDPSAPAGGDAQNAEGASTSPSVSRSTKVSVSLGSNGAHGGISGSEQAQHLVRQFLNGQAGGQDLAEMFNSIAGDGSNASVAQQADGSYLLTIPPHGDSQDTISVSYLEGRGVAWAMLTRPNGGQARIDFADDAIDPQMLDRNRVIEPGRTWIIDANSENPFGF